MSVGLAVAFLTVAIPVGSTAIPKPPKPQVTCSALGSALEAVRPHTSAFVAARQRALANGCAAYVATSSTPSRLDLEMIRGPLRGRAITIGRVVTKSRRVSLTDIALTSSGTLYGVDFTSDLYVINPADGAAKLVGPIGTGVNGLVVGPTGTLYGSAGYGLVTINPATGVGTQVGLINFASSGDLAFSADGTLYMTASASISGAAPSDLLVDVNTATAAGTLIGPTGHQYVYGLVVNRGTMFATTEGGDLLSIDPSSGVSTVLATGGPSSNGMASSPNLVALTSTPSTTASSSKPTFAAVERAACAGLGAHDSEGDRCAVHSMHVSTVSPEWVFVQGLGYYTGTDQPPRVQEARSDLDEAILNLRTHRLIGPTNVGFCHVAGTNVSGPDLSAVPTAVILAWGLHPCTSGSSPSVTTVVPSTTAPVAPSTTPPSASAPPTPAVSEFTQWSGSWGAHEQALELSQTGGGHLSYQDLTLCPNCSFGGAPTSTMDFQLTSVNGGTASGTVTASSDPTNYAVGQVVTVSLAPGSPGQLLELSVAGQGPGAFCNSTSAGQCGA
jgi:hypothetical protein